MRNFLRCILMIIILENNDNELRDNFKKKLYFKKYYQEHQNDLKAKNDTQEIKDF